MKCGILLFPVFLRDASEWDGYTCLRLDLERNRQSAGPVIDAEMNKLCERVTELVAEAELLKQDKRAVLEKLTEIHTVIVKMKELTTRAQSQRF